MSWDFEHIEVEGDEDRGDERRHNIEHQYLCGIEFRAPHAIDATLIYYRTGGTPICAGQGHQRQGRGIDRRLRFTWRRRASLGRRLRYGTVELRVPRRLPGRGRVVATMGGGEAWTTHQGRGRRREGIVRVRRVLKKCPEVVVPVVPA